MSGISHKQAIQLIHRRLDGLLNQRQILLLDEHLRSCDSCRDYTNNMNGLSAHLQNEFHRRWDARSEPSQKVSDQVMAKARNIPMTNRISSSAKLLAGAMALILLGVVINFVVLRLQSTSPVTNATKTVDTSPLPQERLLAFASAQNGNFDIYTMHADGTDLTNLTNNPASDTNPIWSPDGKRIAFMSDRTGLMQVYMMNADGSNVVLLTDGQEHQQINIGSGAWSPDGSKIVYAQDALGLRDWVWMLYMMDVDQQVVGPIAQSNSTYSSVTWSPDGKQIVFITDDSQDSNRQRIYAVGIDGNNRRDITKLLPTNERLSNLDYSWSRDGQSIFFIAQRHMDEGKDQWVAYEADLSGDHLVEKATSSTQMQDWWNGTSFIIGNGAGSPLTWLRSDKTYSTLNPLENCEIAYPTIELHYGVFPGRSSNGDQIIVVTCPNNDLLVYYTNSDGTIIKQLLRFPGSAGKENNIVNIIWSPDGKFVAFKLTSPERNSMYILNVSETLSNPSVQPLQIPLDEASLQYEPSWQPLP
jgi:Tol biopolymer transport system component